jgi:hypothetical protein
MFCALPPISGGVIGRGYGLGYNRSRTSTNQLHGGQDFVAPAGAPVYAPIPGRVVFVSSDTGPRISAQQAMEGRVGQVRGMGGYGNAVVLQHDFQLPAPGPLPSGQNPPPLPSNFWTSYNHLQSVPTLRPGDRVTIGQIIGRVGSTTNGQFPGMGAHLHFEVRKRPFPGNYNRDTVDPNVLWYSLGFSNPGARIEVQRTVGGVIVARPGGPSDCDPSRTNLRGLGDLAADMVEPPDYAPPPEAGVALPVPRNCPGGAQLLLPGAPCVTRSQAAGGIAVAGLAAVALLGLFVWGQRES